ncbi:unnamed protein product [Spodoptera littoralis]|uniref:Uncharacterized protein n=1 Tax=Spodoptera littoralis TaxID=7109 RepID=A0A9P0N8C4_SPOLI|nr:unnamed protein product [Spodoptera littoralis]CAH1645245.1 unnamed protein product [Spodoptera littoralis]
MATTRSGQCMWAACSDGGAACVSLALQPLVYVRGPLAPPLAPAPAPPHAPAPAHYMQPAAAARLVAWSLGPYSAAVRVCASLTCAAGAVLSHAAPAVGCVLAPAEAPPDLSPDGSPDEPTDLSVELLVLAGEELYNRESSKRPNHKDLSRDTFNIGECHQDPVALRLRLAKCAQQAEYELEVAERAQRGAPRAPRATYQLRGQRECARATDGCTYAVLAPSAPAPSRCGPGRSPPPPRCVELAPDDACRIRGDAHLDPCAHRPRTMIEIDRSASAAAPRPTAAARPAAPRAPSVECGGGPAPSWCANPPPPASAPPRCRRPTIVERLQARPPESPNERRIHTSTIFSKAEKCSKSTTGGLENMLRSKQQLKEAGLGRVVVGNEAGRSAQEAPGGRLELAVPAGTRRVAVRVSLEGAAGGPCPSLPAPPLSAPPLSATSSAPVCGNKPSFCTKASTTSVRQDSWLSIKQIQKKLNRCGESSTDIKAVSRSPGRKHGTMAPTALQKAALPTRRCSSTSALLANTVVVGSV